MADELPFLGIDIGVGDIPDHPARLAELRELNPMVRVHFYGMDAILVTSHELVTAVFNDSETFPASAHYGQGMYLTVLGRTLQTYDGPEHRVQRALVAPGFRPAEVRRRIESLLEPVARELIDDLAAAGPGPVDLVPALTSQYPMRMITEILGLPADDGDRLARWAVGLFELTAGREAALQVAAEFREYLTPAIAERRRNPGSDILSELATTRVEGHQLTDEEIFSFVALLFPAGVDTTYLNLGSTLFGLLSTPGQWEKVVADPDNLAQWAAEEGLRWWPATSYLPRTCPRDVTWQGVHIPGGTMMLLSPLAAGRDPAKYPDPDVFDVDRRPRNLITFGSGPHVCLGAALARAEITTMVRMLAQRFPAMRLDPDQPARITGSFTNVLQGPDRLPVFLRPRWS